MSSDFAESTYVRQIMAFLRGEYMINHFGWIKTVQILRALGVERTEREYTRARNTLNKLVEDGKVERTGDGHFRWRYIPPENRSSSFDNDPIPTEPTETPTPDKMRAPERKDSTQTPHETSELADRVEVLEQENKALTKVINIHTTTLALIHEEMERKDKRLDELQREVNSTKTIEIKSEGKPTVVLEGVMPEVFEKVLDLAICRMNIMLVGPAGCGKTTIGELIAKALSLKFGAVVCTAGMSENHLLGKELQNLSDGTVKFRGTDFVSCFEEGGVFLLDELDAADPNVMLCVNSALSNGYINLPARAKKPRANRHSDFICIATANTIGRGATRQYSGRNQLDEATIDRFRMGMIECDYDKRIEKMLCPDEDLLNILWEIRGKIETAGLRRILSTRFIADAYKMKSMANWKVGDILATFFTGWTEDEKRKVQPTTPAPGHSPFKNTWE